MTSLEHKKSYDAILPEELSTDDASVTIEKLSYEDSEELLRKIRDNAEHLARGGLYHHWQYENVEDIHKTIDDPAIDLFGVKLGGEIIGDLRVIQDEHDPRKREISRWIEEDKVGKGIGTTVLRAVALQADIHNLDLVSKIEVGNIPSRKSVEKLGFVRTRTEKSPFASIKSKNVFVRKPAHD